MAEILFLSNNESTKPLYEWICKRTSAVYYDGRLSVELLEEIKPRLVVSYNYRYIISEDCIAYMHGRIINMHISLLPWNKGASPNIWSFIDDTPKGVTIHELSPKLDGGNIICQKEVVFDLQKDTLASSYEKLNSEITELFKEHWDELYAGTYQTFQQTGKGSYHTMRNLEEFAGIVDFAWTDRLCDFCRKVAERRALGELK